MTVSSKNFIFLSLTDSLFSKRHYIRLFTTFLNILQKLIYSEGRNYIPIGYQSYSVLFSPDKPMKGGDILDFYKGENLRKGGVDLEKVEYDPSYQL